MANKRSLGKKRCKKGSTRCVTTGECHVKKTGDKTKCKNGMRKCADGKCYAHSRKKGLLVKEKKVFKYKKPLTAYEGFCQDKNQRAQARREVIDEADEEHEDELPTEAQIQKKLDEMWKDKQDDKEFFENHYNKTKK